MLRLQNETEAPPPLLIPLSPFRTNRVHLLAKEISVSRKARPNTTHPRTLQQISSHNVVAT